MKKNIDAQFKIGDEVWWWEFPVGSWCVADVRLNSDCISGTDDSFIKLRNGSIFNITNVDLFYARDLALDAMRAMIKGLDD